MPDLRVLISAFACLTSALAVSTLRKHGCSPYADVVFILDGSESIRRMDFDKTKNYVKQEVATLNVFPDGAKVAVIVYSNEVTDVIPFSDSRDVAQLESAIMSLRQPRVGTNTASALQEAERLYRREGRSDATKIVVLITDGDARDRQKFPARQEAETLKRQNITIIAIGVGPDVDTAELNLLASERRYVKKVETFAGLEMLPLPYHEVCPPVPDTSTPSGECTRINGNIVFIFDGSESISVEEERNMKDFIKSQIDNLELGSGRAGMGLVMFSNDATTEIRLTNAIGDANLKRDVDNLRLPSQGSNIAQGIEVTRQMFRSYGNPGQNRIAVLITDGVSIDDDETTRVAADARRDGLEIVAIGVGSEGQINTTELQNIAGEDGHVLTFETFDEFALTAEFASKLRAGFDCDTTTSRIPTITPTTTATWTPTRTKWTTTTRAPRPTTTTTWIPTTTRRDPTTTTTTTTTRRVPPSTTRIPSPPVVDPIGSHPDCLECKVMYGSGFARHNSSCEKFIRCIIRPTGDGQYFAYNPVVYDCPQGLFWDQDTLTCLRAELVDCPLDRCRTEPNLEKYGDPTDCAVYWLCANGRSLGKRCCPQDFAFDDRRGECVRDDNCVSTFCHYGSGGGECFHEADDTDVRFFFVNDNGNRVRQACGAGLAFQPSTCGCHLRIDLPTQRVPQGCEPDVYLPFDEDFSDQSGWGRAVGNSGAEIEAVPGAIGGGAGKFDGTDSVWIYRYNNMEFPQYVQIRFRFQETDQSPGQSRPEALVTNGNCGEDPSIAISSERNSRDVSYLTETTDGAVTTRTSYSGGWTEVTYIYDRSQLSGRSGASPQSQDLTGVIRRTHSPLIIGHGQGYRNFTGYIDEFYVYFCEP